jgi:hypothetical protein
MKILCLLLFIAFVKLEDICPNSVKLGGGKSLFCVVGKSGIYRITASGGGGGGCTKFPGGGGGGSAGLIDYPITVREGDKFNVVAGLGGAPGAREETYTISGKVSKWHIGYDGQITVVTHINTTGHGSNYVIYGGRGGSTSEHGMFGRGGGGGGTGSAGGFPYVNSGGIGGMRTLNSIATTANGGSGGLSKLGDEMRDRSNFVSVMYRYMLFKGQYVIVSGGCGGGGFPTDGEGITYIIPNKREVIRKGGKCVIFYDEHSSGSGAGGGASPFANGADAGFPNPINGTLGSGGSGTGIHASHGGDGFVNMIFNYN